jgi:phage baseplate assembly protein W
MASGNLVVAEAILRRWTTPRGALIDDPNYGWDVMDLVSDDLGPADTQHAQQQLAAEAQKDERVQRARVTLTLKIDGTLDIEALIMTANGPFRMVVNVSQISTSLLLVSP